MQEKDGLSLILPNNQQESFLSAIKTGNMKVFKEKQRFTQLWLIIVILFSSIVPIAVVINEYQKKENAFSFEMLLVIILVIILPSAIIFLFKLSTRIDEQGIHYQFFPFHFFCDNVLLTKSFHFLIIQCLFYNMYLSNYRLYCLL